MSTSANIKIRFGRGKDGPAVLFPADQSGEKRPEISLLSGEILPEIRQMDGFCSRKFDADIITYGLDYRLLQPGSVLTVGNTSFSVTRVGKKCYPDCPLHGENVPCPLPFSCAFAVSMTEKEVILLSDDPASVEY